MIAAGGLKRDFKAGIYYQVFRRVIRSHQFIKHRSVHQLGREVSLPLSILDQF